MTEYRFVHLPLIENPDFQNTLINAGWKARRNIDYESLEAVKVFKNDYAELHNVLCPIPLYELVVQKKTLDGMIDLMYHKNDSVCFQARIDVETVFKKCVTISLMIHDQLKRQKERFPELYNQSYSLHPLKA